MGWEELRRMALSRAEEAIREGEVGEVGSPWYHATRAEEHNADMYPDGAWWYIEGHVQRKPGIWWRRGDFTWTPPDPRDFDLADLPAPVREAEAVLEMAERELRGDTVDLPTNNNTRQVQTKALTTTAALAETREPPILKPLDWDSEDRAAAAAYEKMTSGDAASVMHGDDDAGAWWRHMEVSEALGESSDADWKRVEAAGVTERWDELVAEATMDELANEKEAKAQAEKVAALEAEEDGMDQDVHWTINCQTCKCHDCPYLASEVARIIKMRRYQADPGPPPPPRPGCPEAARLRALGADELGRRLLHAAAEGETREVWELVRAGASVNFSLPATRPDLPKEPPLGLEDPREEGWTDVEGPAGQIGPRGFDDEEEGGDAIIAGGNTPLHMAAMYGHEDTADVLLRLGADVNRGTVVGATPLHHAAHSGYNLLVELLVRKGACVNAQCDLGFTPLHEAADSVRNYTVSKLLQLGADPWIANRDGDLPLNLAEQRYCCTISMVLRKAMGLPLCECFVCAGMTTGYNNQHTPHITHPQTTARWEKLYNYTEIYPRSFWEEIESDEEWMDVFEEAYAKMDNHGPVYPGSAKEYVYNKTWYLEMAKDRMKKFWVLYNYTYGSPFDDDVVSSYDPPAGLEKFKEEMRRQRLMDDDGQTNPPSNP